MKTHTPISFCIVTYNQPDVLETVFESLLFQTNKNFELIVADDGSKNETKEIIEHFKARAPFVVKHVWHEDIGYRRAAILNKAFKEAEGECLIVMDGDCVAHPRFVEDHYQTYLENKGHDYVLMGRRVELGEKITPKINKSSVYEILLKPWSVELFKSCYFDRDSRGFFRSFSIKNQVLRFLMKADSIVDIMGCNFSLPTSTMIKINGFNESFTRYFGEDSDVFVRLRNIGCRIIGKKYFATQFHLYHNRRPFTKEDENKYFELLKDLNYKRCENGIAKF
ncbi:MAG: glycosyltransferase [Bacteriovoracaceae bacterium]